jgi:hypothetical protein
MTYQDGDFTIAFGTDVPPAMERPSEDAAGGLPVSAGLSREEVASLIADAISASDARQSDSIARAVNAAARQAEDRRVADRLEMAESFRYFQAAQMNMWKQQVESQQVVASLMQRQSTPAARP